MSTTGYGIVIGTGSDTSGTATNTVVENNIIYQLNTHPAILDARGINTIIQNNLSFGVNPEIGADPKTNTVFNNNLENVDPKFIDVSSKNFALQPDSPAIDHGLSIGDVLFDFAQVPRPQGTAYDIGAYEFQGQPVPEEPPPTTPVPDNPPVTPAAYTNPTIYLSIQSDSVQPQGTVSVDVNVAHSTDLFALQMICTTNPDALVGVAATDGAIFSSSNSLFVNQAYNATDGTWIVAASRTRPETGFSGDGLAFTMNYRLDSLASSSVNCSAIALDMNGNDLPFDVVNTSLPGRRHGRSNQWAGRTAHPGRTTPANQRPDS